MPWYAKNARTRPSWGMDRTSNDRTDTLLQILRDLAQLEAKSPYTFGPDGRPVLKRDLARRPRPAANADTTPKRDRPLCGAKTRAGAPCKARAVPGKRRCRQHGGRSTGPRTPEGRARIAESNRRRALDEPSTSPRRTHHRARPEG